jgi:hypothetical protein
VLRERQLKRGMGFYGSGARVERLVARLQAGQPIVAATLGGSVSWGAGASNRTSTSYPARFFQFLNATFPHRRGSPLLPVFAGLLAAFASHSRALLRCRIACQVITTVLQRITSSPCSRSRDHNFSNRAISATNAGTFATCTERLVPQVRHFGVCMLGGGVGGWGGVGGFDRRAGRVACSRYQLARVKQLLLTPPRLRLPPHPPGIPGGRVRTCWLWSSPSTSTRACPTPPRTA